MVPWAHASCLPRLACRSLQPFLHSLHRELFAGLAMRANKRQYSSEDTVRVIALGHQTASSYAQREGHTQRTGYEVCVSDGEYCDEAAVERLAVRPVFERVEDGGRDEDEDDHSDQREYGERDQQRAVRPVQRSQCHVQTDRLDYFYRASYAQRGIVSCLLYTSDAADE